MVPSNLQNFMCRVMGMENIFSISSESTYRKLQIENRI